MQHYTCRLFRSLPLFLAWLFADAFAPLDLGRHGENGLSGSAPLLHKLHDGASRQSSSSTTKNLSSFERRTDGTSSSTNTRTAPSPVVPNIQLLTSLKDFLTFIDDAPADGLCVVEFYGKTCPLCKRVDIKYKKMAHYYSAAPVQFAKIEKRVHPDLFNTLQITNFPYIQIYRNGQCIASHSTNSVATFDRLVNEMIQQFLSMSPETWSSFLVAFQQPVQQSTAQLNSMRQKRAEDEK